MDNTPEIEQIQNQAEEQLHQLTAVSQLGEQFEAFMASPAAELLEREIFAAFEREAFATITNAHFDPASVSQVAQLKALCQATKTIRQKIQAKIDAGKAARAQILQLSSTLKEGE